MKQVILKYDHPSTNMMATTLITPGSSSYFHMLTKPEEDMHGLQACHSNVFDCIYVLKSIV